MRTGVVVVGLLWAAGAAPAPEQNAPGESELTVCLLDDDLPRAQQSPEAGFDLELMKKLATLLERRLVPVWVASAPPFSEIDDSELPIDRLVRGACDVVPSIPGRIALGDAAEVELTRAYYGAAFELVVPSARDDPPERLEDLGSEVVAVQLQTLGHLVLERRGFRWLARPTPEEALELLDSGDATVALLWGPSLARLGRARTLGWQPQPPLWFNEHIAVSRRAPKLVAEIDRALDEVMASGALEELALRYGIDRRPFIEGSAGTD